MHLSFEQSGCSPGAAVVVGCAVIDAEALFEAVADGLAAGEEDVVGSGAGSSDGEADVVGDPLGLAGADVAGADDGAGPRASCAGLGAHAEIANAAHAKPLVTTVFQRIALLHTSSR
ncbi:MAG: hypothetical protein E7L00_05780 [Propionibacteriaceae bacterium]|nr:hypothetical protein [Propionibacteriaceae bacterium]